MSLLYYVALRQVEFPRISCNLAAPSEAVILFLKISGIVLAQVMGQALHLCSPVRLRLGRGVTVSFRGGDTVATL